MEFRHLLVRASVPTALVVRGDILVEILAPSCFLMYKKNHFIQLGSPRGKASRVRERVGTPDGQ